MRPSFPTPQGLRPICHPSKFLPRTERIRGTIQVRLSFQIDGIVGPSLQGDSQPMNLVEHGLFNGCPERLPYGVFPSNTKKRKKENGTNFYSDPMATTQQRAFLLLCAFLFQQSHLFPICVVSKNNDSRKDLSALAKFQGIVSVNDFRLPMWLQELLHVLLCFLGSFGFARIRLDPLGGQVLHHDCISVIVSRFAILTENFGDQSTKIFCTRYGFMPLLHLVIFGPLTDLAISVFWGNECEHCAYPNCHVSQA